MVMLDIYVAFEVDSTKHIISTFQLLRLEI